MKILKETSTIKKNKKLIKYVLNECKKALKETNDENTRFLLRGCIKVIKGEKSIRSILVAKNAIEDYIYDPKTKKDHNVLALYGYLIKTLFKLPNEYKY